MILSLLTELESEEVAHKVTVYLMQWEMSTIQIGSHQFLGILMAPGKGISAFCKKLNYGTGCRQIIVSLVIMAALACNILYILYLKEQVKCRAQ